MCCVFEGSKTHSVGSNYSRDQQPQGSSMPCTLTAGRQLLLPLDDRVACTSIIELLVTLHHVLYMCFLYMYNNTGQIVFFSPSLAN